MIVYHGTKNKNTYNSIIQNGFDLYQGLYGLGIYCSSDFNFAKLYACEDDEESNDHKELVLKLEIPDNVILENSYQNIMNRYFNMNLKENSIYETADTNFDLCKLVLLDGFKAIKINYLNCDEIIILDNNIIKLIN